MPRLLGRDGIRKRPKASEMLDSLLALGGLVLLRVGSKSTSWAVK